MKAIEIGKPGATTGFLAKGRGGIDVERACGPKPNKPVIRGKKQSWPRQKKGNGQFPFIEWRDLVNLAERWRQFSASKTEEYL